MPEQMTPGERIPGKEQAQRVHIPPAKSDETSPPTPLRSAPNRQESLPRTPFLPAPFRSRCPAIYEAEETLEATREAGERTGSQFIFGKMASCVPHTAVTSDV